MEAVSPAAIAFADFDAEVSLEYDNAASIALNSDYWRVTQAFRYYFDDPSENTYVEIPVGYLTDGASVPRFFWDLLPPLGSYGQAAVLHDFLCENLYQIKNGEKTPITRTQADDALKDAMVALDVPRWKRNVIFIAVAVYVKLADIKGVDIAAGKAAYMAAHPGLPSVP